MILQSESSKSRWSFVSWFWVLGGPTAHTCAHGFTDIVDRADSSNSSNTYRQVPISLRVVSEARGTERARKHSVFARFRYNELKVAAGDCGGCGLMAGPGPTAMGIESFFICNLVILHGLGKCEKSENRS